MSGRFLKGDARGRYMSVKKQLHLGLKKRETAYELFWWRLV